MISGITLRNCIACLILSSISSSVFGDPPAATTPPDLVGLNGPNITSDGKQLVGVDENHTDLVNRSTELTSNSSDNGIGTHSTSITTTTSIAKSAVTK